MLAVLLAAAPAVGAEPPPPVWQGVWQGTVGALPVRACLERQGDGSALGAYYYLSRLRPIRLEQQGESKLWLESDDASKIPSRAQWRFDAVGRALLTGSWGDGERQLPFRLTRVAGKIDDEPCGSDLFNAPRARSLKLTATRTTFDGMGYAKVLFDPGPAFEDVTLQTFALAGDRPADRRINARLRRLMPNSAADADWYGCVTGALGMTGRAGDYEASVTPDLITPRWVAASESVGSYCGGAHPDADTTSLLFDHATGATVDLNAWLNDRAVARTGAAGGADGTVAIRPVLRRLIVARDDETVKGDAEAGCQGVAADAEFWDIGVRRGGLSFTPSLAHVEQACANPVLVPWAVLSPWLSAAGRAGAATLAGGAGRR